MRCKGKISALILAGLMVLAGCSSAEPSGAQSSAQENSQVEAGNTEPEIKDIKLLTFTYMDMPDYAATEEKMNEIMHPLGVNVIMEWTTAAAYDDELKMKIAGGEAIDLCPLKDSLYAGMVGNGSLMLLDDLLAEQGKDITAAFEDGYSWLLDAARINGGIYAVPVLDNKFSQNVVRLQTEYLEKYQIDTSTIHTYKDLTPIFEIIHKNEPNMKIIIKDTMSPSRLAAGMFNGYDDFEGLGDSIGGLFGTDNWDVVNVYESEQYKEYCEVMHEWYKAGYISPDITTTSDTFNTYWQTGNAFACFAGTTDLTPQQSEAWAKSTTGIDTTFIGLGQQKANFLKFLQIVPVTSQNPEGAMIFLNELYKNTELVNTLYYGKEGVDWNFNSEGLIEGIDGSSYFANSQLSFMFGNYYISSDDHKFYPGFVKDCAEAMKTCVINRSLGFFFDTSKVATQYTAVQNVISEYRDGLDYGILDPETELANFNNKLENAGIKDIIAEKQAQLDQWVEKNKK